MALTIDQVRYALQAEEPAYRDLQQLGPEAMDPLAQLAKDPDPSIAAKATYLASLIDHPRRTEVVAEASRSDNEIVRIAAAGAARNLSPEVSSGLLSALLDDAHPGVRHVALRSVPVAATQELREKVGRIASGDSAEHVKAAAQRLKDARKW